MRTTAVFALAATTLACSGLRAQCSQLWASSGGFPGASDGVGAIATWDPDGAGPAAARLVVGGGFHFVGAQRVDRVAMLDPTTGVWSPLQLGLDGGVAAFATLSTGELAVAGSFGGAFGTISPGLVKWNGTSWSSVGGGVSLACYALLPLPGGGLIATGLFGAAGGVPASAIAQWDGTTWSPLGSGLGGPFAVGSSLVRLPNGDVVVGGEFTSAGGVPAQCVARWNGSTWSAMPGLTAPVRRLALAPGSGDLIALTGSLMTGTLQRWNGATWVPFAALAGSYARATSLDVLASGDLAVGGEFTGIGGTPATNLARFDGTSWHALGNAANPAFPSSVHAAPGGDLYVGGSFAAIGSLNARGIARWDGTNWHALGNGLGAPVVADAVLHDGRQVVATIEGRVLRRDGGAWTALGAPLPSIVRALQVLATGDLVVAGDFTFYTPNPTTQVLRWSGTAWVPYATPLTDTSGSGLPWLTAMLALPDGSLLVGGKFTHAGGVEAWNVARWDGTAWQAWQQGVRGNGFGNPARVTAFLLLPDGSIAVGGEFRTAGPVQSRNVARWDGSSWSGYGTGVPAPSGTNYVNALTLAGNGELVAGGWFTTSGAGTPNYLARWSGTAWVSLGTGVDAPVSALVTLPGGDVVAGGTFTVAGGGSAAGLARWNGSSWSALGSGLTALPSPAPVTGVSSLRFLADGRLSVAGNFASAGGVFSPHVAWLASTCPASVAAYGAGCTGSGGTLTLASRDLPWLGGTMCNEGNGLLPTSLVARALGFAPSSLPLASLHPAGGFGCDLLVDPVVLDFVLPLHGVTVTTSLAIPAATSLLGATVREQVVEFELDVFGAFLRINASNALFATLGAF
jgi:hypothetical protein